MFTQALEARLEGHAAPVLVTTDQRDVAQVEMLEWYGQTAAPLTVLRHLAYTAMTRQKLIPAGTSWEKFNTELCIDVDAVGDDDDEEDGEGEQGPTPTRSDPGPATTSGPASSTSPKRRASRSPGRQASNPGTRGT